MLIGRPNGLLELAGARSARYRFAGMTAKEKLRQRIEALTEEEAAEALRLLDLRADPVSVREGYPSVFPVPAGRPATAAEFEQHFGDLPADGEP